MKLTEQIRKYIECPQFGNNHYGKWGALPYDQRLLIKKLCDQCDIYEDAADKFAKENELLKSIVKLEHPEIGEVKHFGSGLTVILDKCVESKAQENVVLKEALKLACDFAGLDTDKWSKEFIEQAKESIDEDRN